MSNNQTNILPEARSGERGFTLIELGVVVFLIGLMLFVAVPKVRDTMLTDDLEKIAKYLTVTARELRNGAVRNQIDYIMHLDLDDNIIWIYSADMTPEAKKERKKSAFKLPGEVEITDVCFPYGNITDGDATIRFSRKDYTQPAAIHLAEKDRRFTVVLEPFLHSAKTYDGYVDLPDYMVER